MRTHTVHFPIIIGWTILVCLSLLLAALLALLPGLSFEGGLVMVIIFYAYGQAERMKAEGTLSASITLKDKE